MNQDFSSRHQIQKRPQGQKRVKVMCFFETQSDFHGVHLLLVLKHCNHKAGLIYLFTHYQGLVAWGIITHKLFISPLISSPSHLFVLHSHNKVACNYVIIWREIILRLSPRLFFQINLKLSSR